MNLRDRKLPSKFGSALMRARFEAKVVVNLETGCHEWCGVVNSRGYGQLRMDGKLDYAHRIAWRLRRGNIPEGLRVLHHCDNTLCVNPAHLFVGTQLDNIRDMWEKGRQPKHLGLLSDEERLEHRRESRRQWGAKNKAHIAKYNREYNRRRSKEAD